MLDENMVSDGSRYAIINLNFTISAFDNLVMIAAGN
jgi:hypothetical protein